MDLNCSHCGQKYHIPEYRLDDRRVYFHCEKCGSKVVVDRKDDPWRRYRGFSREKETAPQILEGFFFSFNLRNWLVSFILLSILILFNGLFAVIGYQNANFFMARPVLSGVILFFLFIVSTYAWDMGMYLVSRNTWSMIRENRIELFSRAGDEIRHDFGVMALLSPLVITIALLLVLPILPLREHGIIYAGILNPVLVFFSLAVLGVLYLKIFLWAFLAGRSRSFRFTIVSFMRFLRVENINVPVYLILIQALMTVAMIIGGMVLLAGFFFILITMAGSTLSAGMQNPGMLLNSMFTGYSAFGASIFIITGGIIVLGLLSWFVNLRQVLGVSAMHIMENNPGHSVHRGLLVIVLVIFLGAVSAFSSLVQLLM
jgi:DNA-directed RNA polymerase subunit RPC12/RpoP